MGFAALYPSYAYAVLQRHVGWVELRETHQPETPVRSKSPWSTKHTHLSRPPALRHNAPSAATRGVRHAVRGGDVLHRGLDDARRTRTAARTARLRIALGAGAFPHPRGSQHAVSRRARFAAALLRHPGPVP